MQRNRLSVPVERTLRWSLGLILVISAVMKIAWPSPGQVAFLSEVIPGKVSLQVLSWIGAGNTAAEAIVGTGLILLPPLRRYFSGLTVFLAAVWISISFVTTENDCGCLGEVVQLSDGLHRTLLVYLLFASSTVFYSTVRR